MLKHLELKPPINKMIIHRLEQV